MSSLWIHESEDVYADDNYYVFARGEYVVALSSRGEGAAPETLAIKGLPARLIGDTLTNVLDPRVGPAAAGLNLAALLVIAKC
jgi:hypothetical protein